MSKEDRLKFMALNRAVTGENFVLKNPDDYLYASTFYTGKFWYNDDELYEEVCPYCGCYPTLTLEDLDYG